MDCMYRYWLTKTGQKISVKKLTDSHIVNILRYFDKNVVPFLQEDLIEYVIEEAKKRGIYFDIDYELESNIDCGLDNWWELDDD